MKLSCLVEKQIKAATQQEVQELSRKLAWMKETEMAVVVSQEQNEIQTFRNWGLDIEPHRAKMEKRELDKEFKDSDIQVLNGRYGPYIKHSGGNYRIPKGTDASSLSEEDCLKIVSTGTPSGKKTGKFKKK